WSLDVGAFLRPWSVVPWAIGQAMLTTALKPPLRRQPPNRLNRKERRERKGKPMKDLVARRDLPQEQAHDPFVRCLCVLCTAIPPNLFKPTRFSWPQKGTRATKGIPF